MYHEINNFNGTLLYAKHHTIRIQLFPHDHHAKCIDEINGFDVKDIVGILLISEFQFGNNVFGIPLSWHPF